MWRGADGWRTTLSKRADHLGGAIDRVTQRGISVLAVGFAAYMIYATFYGPYKTTLVHHALFLIVMMVIYFLDQREAMVEHRYGMGRRLYDWLFAALVIA